MIKNDREKVQRLKDEEIKRQIEVIKEEDPSRDVDELNEFLNVDSVGLHQYMLILPSPQNKIDRDNRQSGLAEFIQKAQNYRSRSVGTLLTTTQDENAREDDPDGVYADFEEDVAENGLPQSWSGIVNNSCLKRINTDIEGEKD